MLNLGCEFCWKQKIKKASAHGSQQRGKGTNASYHGIGKLWRFMQFPVKSLNLSLATSALALNTAKFPLSLSHRCSEKRQLLITSAHSSHHSMCVANCWQKLHTNLEQHRVCKARLIRKPKCQSIGNFRLMAKESYQTATLSCNNHRVRAAGRDCLCVHFCVAKRHVFSNARTSKSF